jgi:hypothetical protein
MIITVIILFAGCTEKIDNAESELAASAATDSGDSGESGEEQTFNSNQTHETHIFDSFDIFDSADVPVVWERLYDTFARDDSSQYNNATLMMKYLSNGCVIFEFRLMDGSESEDSAFDTVIPGILIIDDNGAGFYETAPDAYNPFSIRFVLSEDGETVDVTHEGALSISPDGRYSFAEAYFEVSKSSAGAILEHLPPVLTSLNSNLGAFTVNYPDSLISDWFYTVEAVFADSGLTLAKFLIAKDLSAVFRVDDDIEPVMIFGSAQPMMDAYVIETLAVLPVEGGEEEDGGEHEDSEDSQDFEYDYRQLIYVTLDSGAYMTPGMSGLLTAVIPGDLPYTWEIESLDESVAVVDENGRVTAVGEGETVIACAVMCEDGVALTGVYIYVTDSLEYDEVIPGNDN